MRKRLTERDEYGNADIIGVDGVDLQSNLLYEEMNKVTNALNKLAEYEDLEEQGLILRLPCKVGDTVYSIIETRNCSGYRCTLGITCDECKFNDISYVIYQRKFNPDKVLTEINKTVFLTQAEAEEKLRELEGK